MAENTNILEINGLHKNFFIRGQKFEVLAGVDLTVKKGERMWEKHAVKADHHSGDDQLRRDFTGWGAGKRAIPKMQHDIPGGKAFSLADRRAEHRVCNIRYCAEGREKENGGLLH